MKLIIIQLDSFIRNIIECPESLKMDHNKGFIIYSFDYIAPMKIYGEVDFADIKNLNGTHTTMFAEKYSLDMLDKDYQFTIQKKYKVPKLLDIIIDFTETVFSIN